MTWNLQNITLTDAVSPMDGVTVGKFFIEKDVYICVIRIDNGECSATYRFTDMYQQHYWTDVIPQ